MKRKLITFLYTLLFYLAILMIPYSRWIEDENIAFLLHIITRFLLLGYIIYDIYIKDKRVFRFGKLSPFYIPLIIGAFSNWLCLFSNSFIINDNRDVFKLMMEIFNTIIIVCIEEIIFRELSIDLFSEIFKNNKNHVILTILCSSLTFGLAHGINALASAPLVVLEQIGYTFVLGLILGAIRMNSESISYAYLGHLSFNLFNSVIFGYFFTINVNYTYLIISISVSLLLVVYTYLISIMKKGENKNAS